MTAVTHPPKVSLRTRVVADPDWLRPAVGLLGWTSLVIVTALWTAHGGVADLTRGYAPALNALGRLSGLLSADLLLIQVALMARIPWLERSFGQDELARVHRLTGFASINLLLVHLVLITMGYASEAKTGVLAQTWDFLASYPGMLLAFAGTACLIMVAVTSVRAARKRLRYESWHLLHLYAYIGVGLSLPHELWVGADFTASAWARGYWWGAYLAVAASVVAYRVAQPVARSLRHRLVVERVVPEAPGIYSVHLRGRNLHRLPVRAGQFFFWRFLDGTGSTRAHPFSLSAPPHPTRMRITVRAIGDGTTRISRLRPGTRVMFEGPFGRLTSAVRRHRKVTMIAAGVGIAPIRGLLEEPSYAPGHAVLIYRTSGQEDLVFGEELQALSESRGITVYHLPGSRNQRGGRDSSWLPAGISGYDGESALRRMVPDIVEHDVYVCGPPEWAAEVVKSARRAGASREQIHVERFDW